MELYKFYGLYYSCKWKNNFRKWPIVIHSKLWSFHPILIGVTNLFSAIYQGYKSIEKDWFGTHLWGKVEEWRWHLPGLEHLFLEVIQWKFNGILNYMKTHRNQLPMKVYHTWSPWEHFQVKQVVSFWELYLKMNVMNTTTPPQKKNMEATGKACNHWKLEDDSLPFGARSTYFQRQTCCWISGSVKIVKDSQPNLNGHYQNFQDFIDASFFVSPKNTPLKP